MSISRRNFLKIAGFGALGMGLTGSLFGCSSQEQASSSSAAASVSGNADEVIIVMNTESEPSAGFDPLFSWGCGEHVHEPLIQSTLITTNTQLEFVNDLATNYGCSDDGLVWTFNIRDDVKFTDGEPLTAEDVAFTINGIAKSTTDGVADLTMVKKATATSDTCVEIELTKPFNALLYTLAVVGIVPKHAYNSKTYGSDPIGSGRYMLEQWDKGQQVILKANPNYYGDAPLMQRVVIAFMEEDAALAAAQSGQADIAYTAATKATTSVDGYELMACDTVDSRGISLPTMAEGGTKADGDADYKLGNDVTCNIEVRRALNYGIDRETLVANVLNGYGEAAYSVSDGMPWASDDMKVEFSADEATRVMEEAGWAKNDDDFWEKDGFVAKFNVWYAASDSVRQAIAEEFANQAAALGFDVTPKGGSWDGTDSLYTKEYSEPVLWGWGSNSPTEIYDLNYSSGWGNFATYESKTIDAHLDAALAKTNIEDSYAEYQAAQWDGTDGIAPCGAATWVWLCNVDHLYFKRPELSIAEQKPHPHGHGWSLVNNVDKWSW